MSSQASSITSSTKTIAVSAEPQLRTNKFGFPVIEMLRCAHSRLMANQSTETVHAYLKKPFSWSKNGDLVSGLTPEEIATLQRVISSEKDYLKALGSMIQKEMRVLPLS